MRLVVAAVTLIALVPLVGAQQPGYDLLITNARILDGTGQPARDGDIAVRGGRIVAVGRVAPAMAEQRIDASGLSVSPGFIDSHLHASDLTTQPTADALVRGGITTVVAGTDGFSAVDIGDALEEIRSVGLSVNYATFVGHSTVRLAVMGKALRDPLLADMNRMKAMVFRAIADGAIGFSTGLQSVPGRYARNSEIVALVRVAASERGIYAAQIRTDTFTLDQSVTESMRLAESLVLPIQLSGLRLDPAKPTATTAVLKLIDDARRRNLDVWVDQDVYAESGPDPNAELDRLLQHPLVTMTADHLRVFADVVRDRHVMTLAEAIRRMTSLPAARLGFAGRGVITEGAAADLVIFDPARVVVRDVIVNGVIVLRDGQHTGARPGRVLRRSRSS